MKVVIVDYCHYSNQGNIRPLVIPINMAPILLTGIPMIGRKMIRGPIIKIHKEKLRTLNRIGFFLKTLTL
jgi:hypothetical protein